MTALINIKNHKIARMILSIESKIKHIRKKSRILNHRFWLLALGNWLPPTTTEEKKFTTKYTKLKKFKKLYIFSLG
jgi:hypothetical protein